MVRTLRFAPVFGCVLALASAVRADDALDAPKLRPLVSLAATEKSFAAHFSVDRAGRISVDVSDPEHPIGGPNHVVGQLTREEQAALFDALDASVSKVASAPTTLSSAPTNESLALEVTMGGKTIKWSLGAQPDAKDAEAYKAMNAFAKRFAQVAQTVAERDPEVKKWTAEHGPVGSILDGVGESPRPVFTPEKDKLYHWDPAAKKWAEGPGAAAGPFLMEPSKVTPGFQTAIDNGWARTTKRPDGWVEIELLDPMTGRAAGAPAPASETSGLLGKTTTQVTKKIE